MLSLGILKMSTNIKKNVSCDKSYYILFYKEMILSYNGEHVSFR